MKKTKPATYISSETGSKKDKLVPVGRNITGFPGVVVKTNVSFVPCLKSWHEYNIHRRK